jgi:ubiquinone/menaquinone biosynthesis C-methylase UbiE
LKGLDRDEGAVRLKLALADAMALPFADASFDVIIMIHLTFGERLATNTSRVPASVARRRLA